MKELNNENFESEVSACNFAIVDFYTTWCGPCKALSGILEKIEKEIEDVNFFKCDAEENNDVAAKFGIRNVPSLLFFKDGEAVNISVGLYNEKDILKHIDNLKNA